MPIEHRPPTEATAKQLYATAFCCAYPGCSEPLYREDDIAGTWTLNSRICHICARSEGGPRWNAAQPAEENRSEHNLVLMCPHHASVIDDAKIVDRYPETLLQKWKAAQIEEHRRRVAGWPLTTAMAGQALAASFPDAGIAISNSMVYLGGEGGRAPGAGGGGGGAMGRDARGGQGGRGGDHHDVGHLDLRDPATWDRLIQKGVVEPEPIPGAGGGGAGAVGDGALGGDGGDGGDSATGTFSVEPGMVLHIEVGQGGLGAELPGQHGRAGADSVIRVQLPDGSLREVMRAKGGGNGRAGNLPDDATEVTEADLAAGFQISTLMLINAAEVRDGLLYILGGGWDTFWVQALPFNCVWPVLSTAAWGALQSTSSRWIQICLTDPNGTEVSRVAHEVPTPPKQGSSFHCFTSIGAPLDREGIWALRIQSGGFVLSEIQIEVALVTAGQG